MLFPTQLSQSSWPALLGTWQSISAVSAEYFGILHSILTTVLLLLPPPSSFFQSTFQPCSLDRLQCLSAWDWQSKLCPGC